MGRNAQARLIAGPVRKDHEGLPPDLLYYAFLAAAFFFGATGLAFAALFFGAAFLAGATSAASLHFASFIDALRLRMACACESCAM